MQRRATGRVVELLLNEALKRGSTDNVSSVLVLLDPALRVRLPIREPSAYQPPAPTPTHLPTHAPPKRPPARLPPALNGSVASVVDHASVSAGLVPSHGAEGIAEPRPGGAGGGVPMPPRSARRALLLGAVLLCALLLLRSAAASALGGAPSVTLARVHIAPTALGDGGRRPPPRRAAGPGRPTEVQPAGRAAGATEAGAAAGAKPVGVGGAGGGVERGAGGGPRAHRMHEWRAPRPRRAAADGATRVVR